MDFYSDVAAAGKEIQPETPFSRWRVFEEGSLLRQTHGIALRSLAPCLGPYLVNDRWVIVVVERKLTWEMGC